MKREKENGTTNSSESSIWRNVTQMPNKLLIRNLCTLPPTEEERVGGKWDYLVLTNISTSLLWTLLFRQHCRLNICSFFGWLWQIQNRRWAGFWLVGPLLTNQQNLAAGSLLQSHILFQSDFPSMGPFWKWMVGIYCLRAAEIYRDKYPFQCWPPA